MTTRAKAINAAEKLGVIIPLPEYYPGDRSWELQVEAPDGKQWSAGDSIHLVAVWYGYDKGGKDEAYEDLIMRMACGLDDIDETINPQ